MAPIPGAEGDLLRSKIINETKWIVYCCCEGWGLGPMSGPLVAAESKQLCLRSSVSTTGIMDEDGLCNQVQVVLCITQQCQLHRLPTRPRAPASTRSSAAAWGRPSGSQISSKRARS